MFVRKNNLKGQTSLNFFDFSSKKDGLLSWR